MGEESRKRPPCMHRLHARVASSESCANWDGLAHFVAVQRTDGLIDLLDKASPNLTTFATPFPMLRTTSHCSSNLLVTAGTGQQGVEMAKWTRQHQRKLVSRRRRGLGFLEASQSTSKISCALMAWNLLRTSGMRLHMQRRFSRVRRTEPRSRRVFTVPGALPSHSPSPLRASPLS